MPIYNAPIEDMMFLFDKLRNNKNYNEIEKYKEVNSELVKNILDEAAKINQNKHGVLSYQDQQQLYQQLHIHVVLLKG